MAFELLYNYDNIVFISKKKAKINVRRERIFLLFRLLAFVLYRDNKNLKQLMEDVFLLLSYSNKKSETRTGYP